MEEIVFQPDYAGVDKNIWMGIIFIIISLVTVLFLNSKKEISSNYRGLGLILFGFIGVIALGIVVFSTWSVIKLTDVVITESTFTSPYGEIKIENISQVYIKADQHPKGLFQVSADKTTHYLIVEGEMSINHILSEVNYDIKSIKRELDHLLPK